MLERASVGDAAAWGALLTEHEPRLCGMVAFRLHPSLRGRVDAADVIQDAFIVATARRSDFFGQTTQPLFLWLRWIVRNTLLDFHRHHLGTKMRDAGREAAAHHPGSNARIDDTGAALVAQLSAGGTGPATAAGRAEVKVRLSQAMAQLESIDREVLALRHFEQLTNGEAAQVLGIKERAAAKRYVRALERLREMLSDMPGGLTGLGR